MNIKQITNILIVGFHQCKIGSEDFLIKLLTLRERALIENAIAVLKDELIAKNVMTVDDMVKEAGRRGLWTSVNQKQYDLLPKKIKQMEDSIKEGGEFFARRERPIIEKLIDNAKKKYEEVSTLYSEITKNALETHLKFEELKHIAFHVIYKDSKRFFDSLFEVAMYPGLDKIISAICGLFDELNEKNIRAVARSNLWISTYMSGNKTSYGIWGKHSIDLSDEQLLLLQWSRTYESIYSDPEAPSDTIINDDEKIDAWLKQRRDEREKDRMKRSLESGNRLGNKPFIKKSPFDRREVFLPSDKDNAHRIYSMNDNATLNRLKHESSRISSKGKLSDAALKLVPH